MKSRTYCASCARPLRRGTYARCPLGCGAALCRKAHCGNQHVPNNCPVDQARRGLQEEPMPLPPTDRDVLNVAAAIALIAADAAIEDALAPRPPSESDELNAALIRQAGPPGDFLNDLYKLGVFDRKAGE